MTTCIESGLFTCFPNMPLKSFDLFDVQYGAGMSIVMMAFVVGLITICIYLRNRSLPMLSVLGIYEFAVFGNLLASKYLPSQFIAMEWVVVLGVATVITTMILRLIKE